jgi:predicted acylesterase/phospholipase RssA
MVTRNTTGGVDAGAKADQLRISIVLSGGASLGAYEAGALAALLVGVRRLQREGEDWVVVDAVGGASAGALVALLGAHALLEGLDPADFLYEAWVERVSLDLLRRKPGQGLLSFDRLRKDVRDFLGPNGFPARPDRRGQDAPIGLHVSLTGLQGLTYPVRSVIGGERFTATTYADWCRFVLEPGGGAEQIVEPDGTSPLDFVLASAAHPGAFTPALLDRSNHADIYRRHGINNFPESGHIWYTDGGLMQSQPLGYVLAAARIADQRMKRNGPFRRALVLIDPRSEDPSGGSVWTDPDHAPKWLPGLRRALEILPAQSVYEDAGRVEKANTRIVWAEALVESVAPHLADGADEAIRAFLERMEKDRAELPREDEVPETQPRGHGDELTARLLLHKAIADVAGLAGKESVDVNVVSPLALGDRESGGDVPALLAGDFMGDFGGFLNREVRHSDFLLGYASAEAWLADGLRDTGFDDAALSAMAKEVADNNPGDWREANQGRIQTRDLPWSARLALARLSWDALRALGAGVMDFSRFGHRARRSLEKVAGRAKLGGGN